MMADVTYRNGPTSSRVFLLETMNSNTTNKFGLAYTASLPGFYILFLLDMFLCYAVADTISKRHSFGSINTELPTMTITKRLGITLTPLRLHAASTVRIPHSTNNFQNLLPTVRVTPLNLFSASTVNLHGASNSNMFRKIFR